MSAPCAWLRLRNHEKSSRSAGAKIKKKYDPVYVDEAEMPDIFRVMSSSTGRAGYRSMPGQYFTLYIDYLVQLSFSTMLRSLYVAGTVYSVESFS